MPDLKNGRCDCDKPKVVRHTRYDPDDDAKLGGYIQCENCGARMMFDCQFRMPLFPYWKHEDITA